MKRAAAVLTLLGLATPAWAQIPALCSDQPNQMLMNICATKLLEKADRELNANYEKLLGKLDPNVKTMTRDAQRAWLMFRDKECVSRTGGGPNQQGTIWPMMYTECQVQLTRERNKDLAAQVKCPGGDLSCPE